MKLLVILSRVPYPLDKGDKLRAYHQLKELHKRHQITLCCLHKGALQADAIDALESICSASYIVQLNRRQIWLNMALGLFSRKPFQVLYFYQKKAHREIQQIIEQTAPDHIYCQLVRTAEYAKHEYNYPKTIDYQDAFSKGMDRRRDKAKWPLSELFKLESHRLIRYENLIYEFFEHHSIISEEDRRFIYHPERNHVAIISNGIDTEFFKISQVKSDLPYDLVFTGNMQYAPNIEAAEYLVNQVLPLLRRQFPHITLLLAGAEPHRRVRALASQKGVTVSGWMDDIRDAYRSARVFVAPMFIGTGLQNKLLEAMSMEMPCITTPLANASLKATHLQEIHLAESPEAFAENIAGILNNPALGLELGKEARRFVERNFSWAQSTAILERLMSAQKGS